MTWNGMAAAAQDNHGTHGGFGDLAPTCSGLPERRHRAPAFAGLPHRAVGIPNAMRRRADAGRTRAAIDADIRRISASCDLLVHAF
jgi:hypothetical protein